MYYIMEKLLKRNNFKTGLHFSSRLAFAKLAFLGFYAVDSKTLSVAGIFEPFLEFEFHFLFILSFSYVANTPSAAGWYGTHDPRLSEFIFII